MISSVNIILIFLVAYVIYTLTRNKSKINNTTELDKKTEQFKINRKRNKHVKHDKYVEADDLLQDIISWDDSHDYSVDSGVVTVAHVNPNFIKIQFHNDYRDVITAINNIVPDRKQLFNIPNIPLKYSEPPVSEVKNLVNDFVGVLNANLATDVPNQRNPNSGWDEAVVDPTVESGWEKSQRGLGLPVSLYEKPAKKAPVKLIAIQLVQKYETEDEIKYSCDLVLQKVNAYDQMVVKADFVQDKRPLHNENNFFTSKNIQMKVMIENVFINGYLSHEGSDAQNEFDGDDVKFYDYNKLEYDNMTDPKYVQKILMEKYRQKNEEMEQRTAMLDEEGQAFNSNLPNMYDFPNIKGTRTIFDDMNTKKRFI